MSETHLRLNQDLWDIHLLIGLETLDTQYDFLKKKVLEKGKQQVNMHIQKLIKSLKIQPITFVWSLQMYKWVQPALRLAHAGY